ncbi:MAG TPA: hypothetical protein VHZ31_04760 [Solirubrobacteraceae bacterium]|jgi:hypothetical protein|nr:hypothetical protein [Solirubrobacteraceae bacterium]
MSIRFSGCVVKDVREKSRAFLAGALDRDKARVGRLFARAGFDCAQVITA